jgi:hypothetical protein
MADQEIIKSTKRWKRISSKKYQVELDEGWRDIFVPYGKVEILLTAFSALGGQVGEDGDLDVDMFTLVRSFGELGDILLTEYDNEGQVKEKGSCRDLSFEEIVPLFEIAKDVMENFTATISAQLTAGMEEAPAPVPEEEKAPEA